MPDILAIRDLHVSYGPVRAVRGVTMTAAAGEVVGIVGESGCGKSTLASAMIGLPAPGATMGGEIRIGGMIWSTFPSRAAVPCAATGWR